MTESYIMSCDLLNSHGELQLQFFSLHYFNPTNHPYSWLYAKEWRQHYYISLFINHVMNIWIELVFLQTDILFCQSLFFWRALHILQNMASRHSFCDLFWVLFSAECARNVVNKCLQFVSRLWCSGIGSKRRDDMRFDKNSPAGLSFFFHNYGQLMNVLINVHYCVWFRPMVISLRIVCSFSSFNYHGTDSRIAEEKKKWFCSIRKFDSLHIAEEEKKWFFSLRKFDRLLVLTRML